VAKEQHTTPVQPLTTAQSKSPAAAPAPGRACAPARGAEVLLSWRAPGRQRAECVIWTLLGLAVSVFMEAAGPSRPVSFCLRLPLLVLVIGGTWCAARWRRQVIVTADEVIVRTLVRTRRVPRAVAMCSTALGTGIFIARAQRPWVLRHHPGVPAPVVTPWLVLTTTVGVATLTVKILTTHPQYADALLAGGAAVCCVTLVACARLDRRPGLAVVAEDGLGQGARVVLEQPPLAVALA
jgi:hypothetical protein